MVRPFEGAIKPPITTSGIFRGTVASGRARDSVHNSEPEMAGAARQPGETAVGQGIGAASAAGWSGGYPALGLLPAGRRTRVGGVLPREWPIATAIRFPGARRHRATSSNIFRGMFHGAPARLAGGFVTFLAVPTRAASPGPTPSNTLSPMFH